MKVRLGDVATYINGYTFKPEDWSTIGKPIIRIQDLTGNSYQTNRFDGVVPSKYLFRLTTYFPSLLPKERTQPFKASDAFVKSKP